MIQKIIIPSLCFAAPAAWYAYSVAFFCPLVKMFFAQKIDNKFSRIFLSHLGTKYAILDVVYRRPEKTGWYQDTSQGAGI